MLGPDRSLQTKKVSNVSGTLHHEAGAKNSIFNRPPAALKATINADTTEQKSQSLLSLGVSFASLRSQHF
jgi:hypothetical protein